VLSAQAAEPAAAATVASVALAELQGKYQKASALIQAL